MNSILADFDGNSTFNSAVTSEESYVLNKTTEQTEEEDDNSNDEDEKDVAGKTPEENLAENSTDENGNATFSSAVTSKESTGLDETSKQTEIEDDNSNDEVKMLLKKLQKKI